MIKVRSQKNICDFEKLVQESDKNILWMKLCNQIKINNLFVISRKLLTQAANLSQLKNNFKNIFYAQIIII